MPAGLDHPSISVQRHDVRAGRAPAQPVSSLGRLSRSIRIPFQELSAFVFQIVLRQGFAGGESVAWLDQTAPAIVPNCCRPAPSNSCYLIDSKDFIEDLHPLTISIP